MWSRPDDVEEGLGEPRHTPWAGWSHLLWEAPGETTGYVGFDILLALTAADSMLEL